MTSEHIFYIPTVLSIGFLLGYLIGNRGDNSQIKIGNGQSLQPSLKNIIVSSVLFLIVFVLTHILPFLGGSKELHGLLEEKQIFDKSPSFNAIEVYERVDNFGALGREMYQRFTYSADLLFPISLLFLLWAFSKYARNRNSFSRFVNYILMTFPVAWFCTDIIENVIIFYLLSQFPVRHDFLGSILGPITVVKFVLLFLSVVIPLLASIILAKRHQTNLKQ